jgi:hypothetical protein
MTEDDKLQNQILKDHIESNDKDFCDIKDQIKEIKDLLKPMASAYSASLTLGKWVMGVLTFVSICIGIVLSLKALLKW